MKPLDDGLKQRLVGALVLLALAVIFLPVLFDRDPMAPVDRASQIPRAPEIITVEIKPPATPADFAAAPPPSEMYIPDETRAVPPTPEPPGLAPDGTPKSWVLQVASFRQETHAEDLRKKLAAEGFPAYTRAMAYKNGTVNRVYVGPKLDKEALLREKEAIALRFGLQALVLPFTPD